MSIVKSSSAISSNDDDYLLTEESDGDYISGEDMLSSTIGSVAGGDDILSDGDNENEQDSGYCSTQSAIWISHSISDLNSLSADDREDLLESDGSELGDSQSDLVTRADTDCGEFMFGSSSLPSRTASDIVMESDIASETIFFSEPASQQDAWEDETEEAIMDNSSSMSILASSTTPFMLENLY
jgi:hypothetical protein